jgi:predicted DsbA family dithiol-disulfide isomerase
METTAHAARQRTDVTSGSQRLRIDVCSDVACPWCYIGAARLEKAVAACPHADLIDVVTHSFELDPQASSDATAVPEYVAKKMGVSVRQAIQMENKVGTLADQEELPYAADRVPANSFDAPPSLLPSSSGSSFSRSESTLA